MHEMSDVVDISDDSNESSQKFAGPVIVIEDKPLVIRSGTIILDEDGLSETQDVEVIDLDSNNSQNVHNIDSVFRENPMLAEIVELCLNLENSKGMLDILNKIVLEAYKKTSEEFKKSEMFNKILSHLKWSLEVDPEQKFTHLRGFCNALRNSKIRIKIPLREINSPKNKKKRKRTFSKCSLSKKKKLDVTIHLDKDLTEGNDVINLDDDWINSVEDPEPQDNQIKENVKNYVTENRLLVPQRIEAVNILENGKITEDEEESGSVKDKDNNKKIKLINRKIIWCKKNIQHFENQEVTDDTTASPYIMCEMYKAQIVEFYKQLCNLTGVDPIKIRKVRLKVLDGHPPGPVRILQELLNNNIDSTGVPFFPDFVDVVDCVRKANSEDGLGWKEAQILNEARALFEQCGKALQKRRQHREYRDLMSLINDPAAVDPADQDPVLKARLQQNKIESVKKEKQLYQRYSNKQRRLAPLSLVNPKDSESLLISNINSQLENETFWQTNNNSQLGSETLLDRNIKLQSGKAQLDTNINLQLGSETQLDTNINSQLGSEAQLDSNINSQLDSETQLDTNINSQLGSETQLDTNINLQLGSETQLDTSINSQLGNETQLDTNINLQLGSETQLDTNINSQLGSETQLDTNINLQLGSETQLDTSINSQLGSETQLDTNINLQLGSETQLDININSQLGSEAQLDSNINSQLGSKTQLDTDTEKPLFNESVSSKLVPNVLKICNIASDTEGTSLKVKIKEEPVDVIDILNELGNNYSTRILDIEDLFLVVEISSDEEDHNV